jgi:hypothetical protein
VPAIVLRLLVLSLLALGLGAQSASAASITVTPDRVDKRGPKATFWYTVDVSRSPQGLFNERITRIADSAFGEIYPSRAGELCQAPPTHDIITCWYAITYTGRAGETRTNTVHLDTTGEPCIPDPGPPQCAPRPTIASYSASATVRLTKPRCKTYAKDKRPKRCRKKGRD